jgi:hypothetical protein
MLQGTSLCYRDLLDGGGVIIIEDHRYPLVALAIVHNRRIDPLVVDLNLDRLPSLNGGIPTPNHGKDTIDNLFCC